MKSERKERIEEKLKRIRYRLYQAGIQFASQDYERLSMTARQIRMAARTLMGLLPKKKAVCKRKKIKLTVKLKTKKSGTR